jgi:hypothetical protein
MEGTETKLLNNKLDLIEAAKAVLNSDSGKILFKHLLKECGVTFPKITIDPNQAIFQNGQQHIVLSVYQLAETEPEIIVDAIKEQMDKTNERSSRPNNYTNFGNW